MNILVTGGAGYIGSHTTKKLRSKGHDCIILDNLVYGHKRTAEILDAPLIVGQVGDENIIRKLLDGTHPLWGKGIDAIIHFAAYAYVGESVTDPLKYYTNNVLDTLSMLNQVVIFSKETGTELIPVIFSSTCATYGVPSHELIPISETCPQNPINPYGRSKLMIEQIITDYGRAYGLPSVIFRYFNAAGADPLGGLGENHEPETHLIPLAIQAALENHSNFKLFGNNYPTPDGSCIRDYIHVCDLADAHVLGLEKVSKTRKQHIYNLGNGIGYSVLEIIAVIERITGGQVKYTIVDRREGDPSILIASSKKAQKELGWNPAFGDIDTIINDACKWHATQLAIRDI